MIKAVLFDLDGVLVDSREWHYKALNRALDINGYAGISREDHLTIYDGLPTKKKLEQMVAKGIINQKDVARISADKQDLTLDIISDNAKLEWDKIGMLNYMQQQYKIAVVTNCIRKTTEHILMRTGLSIYFKTIITNEDIRHPKPHAEPYITAMACLGLGPAACLIVEDSEHGIKAAETTGAHVMKVKSPAEVTLGNLMETINKCNC